MRALSICFYVFGGIATFGSLFPLIYVVMGVAFIAGGLQGGPNPPPEFLGWFFVVGGGCASVFILALAVCCLFAGYNLSQRKRYLFCFVVACLCCLQMGPLPLGLILGVFTIVVLCRPSVKESFDAAPLERAPEPEA